MAKKLKYKTSGRAPTSSKKAAKPKSKKKAPVSTQSGGTSGKLSVSKPTKTPVVPYKDIPKKKAKRQQKDRFKKVHETMAFLGEESPSTKREEYYRKKGRHIRKTLAGKDSEKLLGKTSLLSLKDTPSSVVREGSIASIEEGINKRRQQFKKKEFKNDLEKSKARAEIVGLSKERNRLIQRRHLGNLKQFEMLGDESNERLRSYQRQVHNKPKLAKQRIKGEKKYTHRLNKAWQKEQSQLRRSIKHETILKSRAKGVATKYGKEQKKRPGAKAIRAAVKLEQTFPGDEPVQLTSKAALKTPRKVLQAAAKGVQPPGYEEEFSASVLKTPFGKKHPRLAKKAERIYTEGPGQLYGEETGFPGGSVALDLVAGGVTSVGIKSALRGVRAVAGKLGSTGAKTPARGPLAGLGKRGAERRAKRRLKELGKDLDDFESAAAIPKKPRTSKRGGDTPEIGRNIFPEGNIPTRPLGKDYIESLPHYKSGIGGSKTDAIPTTNNPVTRDSILAARGSAVNKRAQDFADDPRMARMSGAGDPGDVKFAQLKQRQEKLFSELEQFPRVKLAGTKLRWKRFKRYGVPVIGLGAGISIVDSDFRLAVQRDTHDLVAGFVPSTLQFLTATGDAVVYGTTYAAYGGSDNAKGSTDRFTQMWEEIKKTDPIALAIQGEWSKAYEAVKQRPVSFALEVGGGYGAIGRGGGAIGRSLPESVRFGKTARETRYVGGTDIADLKAFEYSPNIITKRFQIMGESMGRYLEETSPRYQRHKAERAVIAIEQDMDKIASIRQLGERANRADADRTLNKEVLKPARKVDKKYGPHALMIVASRIARNPSTARKDVQAYRDRVNEKLEVSRRTEGRGEDVKLQEDALDILDSILERPNLLEDKELWAAANKFRDLEAVRQQELIGSGNLHPNQAAFAPWIPYAVNHMGAKFKITDKKTGDGYFQIDGERLIAERIMDDAKQNNVEAPAMISLRQLDGGDAGQFRYLGNPIMFNLKAHGDQIANGTADLSFGALHRQTNLSRTIIDKTRGTIGILDRVALREKGAREPLWFPDQDAANAFKNRSGMHKSGDFGFETVAVNFGAFIRELEKTGRAGRKLEGQREKHEAFREWDDVLEASLDPKKGQEGDKWALVPKIAIDRLNQHAAIDHNTAAIIRKINREFKGSVLAFSPKWHVGNVIDMTTRLFFEGAGPTSAVMGRKILNFIKKEGKNNPEMKALYNDLLVQIAGGHLASAAKAMGDALDAPTEATYASALHRTMAQAVRLGEDGYTSLFLKKTVGRGYRGAQKGSFTIAQFLELNLRTTALGKAAKGEARRLNIPWWDAIRMQPKVIEELAQGLIGNTNIQRQYAHKVNRVMGDYTSLSPDARWAMLHIAPFYFWFRASTKWVLSLPKNSPARVAMIASVNRMNEKERRALGLSTFTMAEHLPRFMLGSVTPSFLGGGDDPTTLYRTNAYTSFGPITELNLAGFVLPQISNTLDALRGQHWTGEDLVDRQGNEIEPGSSLSFGIALQQMLETYVAPVGIAHQIIARGEPDPTLAVSPLSPGKYFSGYKRRKFEAPSMFNDFTAKEEPVGSFGSAASQALLPFHKMENFFVKQRRQEKAENDPDKLRQTSEDEWLGLAEKDKKDKRKSTPLEQENDWLGLSKPELAKPKKKKDRKSQENSWLYGN